MARTFEPALALLERFAETHRDRRNIATHLIGVPLIVFALAVLFSRPGFSVGPLHLSPAWLLCGLAVLWHLTRGQLLLGAAASAGIALLAAIAHRVADGSTASWLAWGLGALAAGSSVQLVGHYYEGRRPSWSEDALGLPAGPMFVTLEMLSPLGLFRPLLVEVERRAGPTRLRDLAHPA